MRQETVIPPWSHNPQAVLTPDGTWVIYTLGPGFGRKPEVDCNSPLPTNPIANGANGANGATGANGANGANGTNSRTNTEEAEDAEVPTPAITGVNFTIHTSSSPHGPWTSTTFTPVGWNRSWTLQNPGNWNPAPVIAADGSVRILLYL